MEGATVRENRGIFGEGTYSTDATASRAWRHSGRDVIVDHAFPGSAGGKSSNQSYTRSAMMIVDVLVTNREDDKVVWCDLVDIGLVRRI
jgi:hypothetical protein